VMLFAMPYLTGLGMARETAGTVIMLYTFASLFGRVPFGMLADVYKKSYVMALSIALQVTGLFLYWLMSGTSHIWSILLFAVPYGLGVSGVLPVRAPVLAEYFGTKNFGSIFGLTSIFISAANVVAPPLAGWIFDTYQDYRVWWLILVFLGIGAFITILTIPEAENARSPEHAYHPIPKET
jgi:MFS family permease